MEDYLRLGLLLLAAVILMLILFESWQRRRRFKLAEMSVMSYQSMSASHDMNEPSYSAISPESTYDDADDIIMLSIFAKPNTYFASYELLQAIASTGMQYGDMNIFHYNLTTADGHKTLFSLASATKPGDFNLDKMGNFSCAGLTLFMDLSAVSEPELAFSKMLGTAEELAEDLDGELYAGPRRPLTPAVLQSYREKIAHFRFENAR